jgi:signal transduction histidine kinase
VFNCRTLKRNGVHQWIVWEVCYILGEYHLLGVMLYDVVSATSHQYEKMKKQLEDVKSIIAHDLRGPISGIKSLLELVQSDENEHDTIVPFDIMNISTVWIHVNGLF